MKKREGFDGQRTYTLTTELIGQLEHNPLTQGLFATDIGYYPKARFHYRDRKNGSLQHIMIYCTQGEGWYQIGESERHSVMANQVFILPAQIAHRYGATEANPWSIYWLHFSGTQSTSFRQYLHGDGKNAPITIVPTDERFRLFDDIFAHLTMSFNADNLVFANACLPHLLATFRESVYKQAVQVSAPDVISSSIDYMKQHLHQPLTLAALAQQSGLSVSHYSSLFRSKTQSSPINFFNFLRMQQACRLLENTALRVKGVASQLGFDDPYHFSRTFHRFTGVSPHAYRTTEKG